MRSKSNPVRLLCVAVLLLFVFVSVQAFAQLETATIVGVIRDSSGAVVPDASVKITNTKTGRVHEAKSNEEGEYTVVGLPTGPYTVEVEREGFSPGKMSDIFLHATDRRAADLTLNVGAAAEQVNVSAESIAVDTQTSSGGAVITTTSITNLPLNGRDFTSLVALVPGAVTTGGFGQNSVGGFETGLAGINVLLDGADATRIDTNATSTQLGRQESRISRASVDSIQEFKVMQSTYSAEFGRSMGDVINVITKSGGNEFHGSVFEYFRNDVFDAKNYFATEDTPLRLNQFGGNLSGPIVRNKLFFFANYEGVRQIVNRPVEVTVLAAAPRAAFVPALAPVIATIPLPNVPGPVTVTDPNTGLLVDRTDIGWYHSKLRNKVNEDTGSAKIDFIASQNDSFAFRYNIADSTTSTQYGVAEGQVSPSTSRNHLFKATWTRTFGAALLNEASFAFNRPQTDSLGGGGDYPIIQCSPFWGCTALNNFGVAPGPALFSQRSPQRSYQVMDTMTLVKGRHSLRFGTDIRKNVTKRSLDPQAFLSYPDLANFQANQAYQLSTLGYEMIEVGNSNLGFFVQDDIRVHPRLTLNLGVRYEYNTVLKGDEIGNFNIETLTLEPKGESLYDADRNNFGPRVGFSWDPFGQGKTVVRGGGGIFYNPLLTGAALSLASNYQQSFNFNIFDLIGPLFGLPGRDCTPFYGLNYPVPSPLPTCVPALALNVNGLDREMRDSYAEHWSLGVQQEVLAGTVLEVNYVGNHGVKLPAGAAYAGQELNLTPHDSSVHLLSDAYGQVRRLGNFLGSNYNAMQVSLRRRAANGLTVDANYTWAHQMDNAVNILTGAFQNSRNPAGDYGDGDIDVRQNFTAGVVYDLPLITKVPRALGEGWQIASLFQTRSGLPVNISLSAPFLGIDQLRPNAPAGKVNLDSDGPNDFFLPASAFTAPDPGEDGTLRRNAGRGPNFAQLDLSLSKTTTIYEKLRMQFRAEAFNLLNHANFASPSGYLDDVNFGKSKSTVGNSVGTGTSRQLQFAVKFLF